VRLRIKLAPASAVARDGSRAFAFVPYRMEPTFRDRQLPASHSFYIAISDDDGASWSFIDNAQLRDSEWPRFLPGYRNDPPLPATLAPEAYR
jgi:hypothetical protein